MASASLTITFTDTVQYTLVQARDLLLTKFNYLNGGGIGWVPLGTGQDKLNFLQKKGALWYKSEIIEQLQIESQATNATANIDIV